VLVPVHEGAFQNLTRFSRQLLAHVNPHTGRRYADEPALAWLAWIELGGDGGFFSLRWGGWTDLLLVMGGALTAIPLIFFAYAVRRVPLSVVGVLQYIGPTLQLLLGVLFFGEYFGPDRAIGFGFIWIGLAVFATDGVLAARRRVVAQQA